MLKEIINNQAVIKKMLNNSYKNNQLMHAYIFNGPNGAGQREMALYFSAMMYCKNDVCSTCDDCRKIFNNEHMNVYNVVPSGQVIKKEQIVDLQKEFSKTSLVEGPRIYIIEQAEKLNASSANSLLKFIEEPLNEHTYGILLTSNIENVLPTIISRCGIINFRGLDKNIFAKSLIDSGINNNAYIISEFTSSIEEAKEFSKNSDFLNAISLVNEFVKIKDKSISIMFLQKNLSFLDNSSNLRYFLDILILFYQELIHNKNICFSNLEEEKKIIIESKGKDEIIKELEIILDIRNKTNFNLTNKNIIINMFVNLF